MGYRSFRHNRALFFHRLYNNFPEVPHTATEDMGHWSGLVASAIVESGTTRILEPVIHLGVTQLGSGTTDFWPSGNSTLGKNDRNDDGKWPLSSESDAFGPPTA